MGSDELERGGNASRGGRCATTDRVTPVAVQRSSGTWRSRCLERVPDTDPGHPVPRAPWRVCCQSCCWRGACAPSLKLPSCSAGQRRKAKPPNRTREIRPSGMTTGAVGNVSNDGIVKPPRISKGVRLFWNDGFCHLLHHLQVRLATHGQRHRRHLSIGVA